MSELKVLHVSEVHWGGVVSLLREFTADDHLAGRDRWVRREQRGESTAEDLAAQIASRERIAAHGLEQERDRRKQP